MADLPELDAIDQRVLGALLEKQVTVPGSYPMTLNALRTACNQTSSRDPVMDLDENTLDAAMRSLRDRELVRIVWAGRTLKYHQRLEERLGLAEDERALITVLLLRGAQAPGELRTRCERLHRFADREAVEATLAAMAQRGLVRELERRPGQHDARWVHLLGPVAVAAAAAPAEAGVDRDLVLRDGPDARDDRVRTGYGSVAGAYADALVTELEVLPFERWVLDRVAADAVAAGRPVVDAGCGPGHVTAYLAAAGANARGVDLTPEMIDEARGRFPGVRFEVGDLTRLMRPESADGWGAVLGWYSLIHLGAAEFATAVAALARPLARGGWLVLGVHAGDEVRHNDHWFDTDVDLDFVLWDVPDVLAAVSAAGLTEVEWYHRGPMTGRGETTERLYVLARKP